MFLQKAGLRHSYVIENTNTFSITRLQRMSLQMQENRPRYSSGNTEVQT
jgi:hypothetical protein